MHVQICKLGTLFEPADIDVEAYALNIHVLGS